MKVVNAVSWLWAREARITNDVEPTWTPTATTAHDKVVAGGVRAPNTAALVTMEESTDSESALRYLATSC